MINNLFKSLNYFLEIISVDVLEVTLHNLYYLDLKYIPGNLIKKYFNHSYIHLMSNPTEIPTKMEVND